MSTIDTSGNVHRGKGTPDGGQFSGKAVGERELVVTGREASPLLVLVEAALYDVAALVVLDVVTQGSATLRTTPFAVPPLIGGFEDHGDDVAIAQMLPDRPGRVRLVAADAIGPGPWTARSSPSNAQMVHQDREHRGVPGLTGADEHDQRQPMPVDEVMDLRTQSAP